MTNPIKCQCERAKKGGAQCMIHNPPFEFLKPMQNEANFVQKGQTFECGHCKPFNYVVYPGIKSDCKCHTQNELEKLGQEHYDNCSNCQNESWRERYKIFIEDTREKDYDFRYGALPHRIEEIESFISSELNLAKQEGYEMGQKSIREVVEKYHRQNFGLIYKNTLADIGNEINKGLKI